MKVLLLGEYSRLHNTLKEGLVSLGHEVTLVGDGDGFKNFPVDLSIRPTLVSSFPIKWIRSILFKLFKIDLNLLERGLRFWRYSKRMKGYDVVQLINEKSIKTYPWLERFLLKKIFRNNDKVFLLSCGADTFVVNHFLAKKPKYSILSPYFENPNLKPQVQYILDYQNESHQKTHRLLMNNVAGIIASDYDYVMPLEGHPKFMGLIPNPVNTATIDYKPLEITDKITILLGVNEWNKYAKGIPYFEAALEIINENYADKVEILKVTSLPYQEYIRLYERAHILLDQVLAYDQGYNALEAMARGKVVFTGAEQEFLSYYGLEENEICFNALPDPKDIASKLIELIENPDRIKVIGSNARSFIEREHDYKKVAAQYVQMYTKN
ncbi:MAG: glycosyltransferase [Bacteroidetes bacterium]|nr:glycosyltransferase [Bacteroidota bacterium]